MTATRRIRVAEKHVFEMEVPERLTGDALARFIEERSLADEENEFAYIDSVERHWR